MVEDRITDGKRIAQLLSSELSGLERGPLSEVAVVDADPDAEPSSDGAFAFAVEHEGSRVGEVTLYPEAAAFRVDVAAETVREAVSGSDLSAEADDGGVVLRIESGAAVKRAVDAFEAGLAA